MREQATSPLETRVTLNTHEWLFVVALVALMGSLTAVTCVFKKEACSTERSMSSFLTKASTVEVLIKGAVNDPGIYYLPSGVLMGDVLMIAGLLPNADLRRLAKDRPVKKGRVINVKMYPMITVHLKGAVKEPKELQVVKGTRLMDLRELIELKENACPKSLMKKRKLKEGEEIWVLEKKGN